MTTHLHDSFVLDGVRKTGDGYLTAFARVARTGIQQYRGYELGRPDLDVVRVYRPPEEVFSADAMQSFAHRPVTLKHPPKPVTAQNWKKYAGGQTGDEVVRDGDHVRVPMVMMDAAMISAYESGIKQLSMGYSTDIKWTSGIVSDEGPYQGQQYDAVQTAIRGNHLALVPVARGGDQLRIGDRDFDAEQRDKDAKSGAAMPDGSFPIQTKGDLENAIRAVGRASNPAAAKAHIKKRAEALGAEDLLPSDWANDSYDPDEDDDEDDDETCPECGSTMHDGRCPECGYTTDGEPKMKTIIVDGLNVNVGDDQSASIVQRVLDGFAKRLKDADSDMDEQKKKQKKSDDDLQDALKTISAKDGEIAVLKKQVADAAVTPARLDDMVKERLGVIDSAVKILGKDFAFDGKTVGEIKKAAVSHKLGDGAKDMDEAAIGGAFAALVVADGAARGSSQAIADSFAGRRPGPGAVNASDSAYDEMTKNIANAWKTPTAAA